MFLVFSAKLPRHVNGTDAIQKYLTPQAATSVSASVISFIIIMILNMIYEKVAIMITDFGKVFMQPSYTTWRKNIMLVNGKPGNQEYLSNHAF